MSHNNDQSRTRRGARWILFLALAFSTGFLAACEDILEVELPGQITEEETFNPGQAEVLVLSAIGDIECALSDYVAMNGAGNADALHRTIGWNNGSMEYEPDPDTGGCSNGENDYGWFTSLNEGRWVGEQVYQRLAEDEEWADVPNREQLMATAAIYIGLTNGLLGEFLCEVAINTGPLLSWDEALEGASAKNAVGAEGWYTRALNHISDMGSDFSIDPNITTSAQELAYLLRARSKMARGDYAGAAADANMITDDFIANVTREAGGERKRWNRVYSYQIQASWSTLVGPITHAFLQVSSPPTNPVTGDVYPDPIPYTGYWNLGILPDGRAVSDVGHPVTTDDGVDVQADTRVPVLNTGETEDVRGYPLWDQQKYTSTADDIPLAKWEEAWLIRAEAAARGQGLAGDDPVVLVNEIRAAHDLNPVTYGPTGEEELLEMIIEENRRTHFLEGRFWSTKLRFLLAGSNVEAIPFPWFPRNQGRAVQHNYQGGVRMVLPPGEYELNPNFSQDDVGTYCPQFQTPVGI